MAGVGARYMHMWIFWFQLTLPSSQLPGFSQPLPLLCPAQLCLAAPSPTLSPTRGPSLTLALETLFQTPALLFTSSVTLGKHRVSPSFCFLIRKAR